MIVKPWFLGYMHSIVDGTDGGGGEGGEGETGENGVGGEGGKGETGENGVGGDGIRGAPQDWPDDWRTKVSADEKHAKTLSRFASPKALFDSYMSLRQKLDSGEIKTSNPFPDKGTVEEKAAWRQSKGIPEKPEDYKNSFEDGLVVGDQDKVWLDDFLSHAHEAHMDPKHVNSVLRWYHGFNEQAQAQRLEEDSSLLSETDDTLRSEWGGEYRRNINLIKGLINGMPEEVQPLFTSARLGNGQILLNRPEVARWLLETALTVNPVGTVVPGFGANIASAIEDQIAQIENTMRTDRKKYNTDEKMQARLRELYAARDRVKK